MNEFGPGHPNYRLLPLRVIQHNREILRLVYSADEQIEPGGPRSYIGLFAVPERNQPEAIELRLDDPLDGFSA